MKALFLVILLTGTGCSLFSSKQEASAPESQAFTSKVSTNSNEIALPVEINQDIGKIAAGGGHFESTSGGGNGKVNVNVNVNFNGSGGGWQPSAPNTQSPSTAIQSEANAINGNRKLDVETNQTVQTGPIINSETRVADNQDSGFSRVPAGEVRSREGREKYVVKAGDTLMKISFEKFGSVYRWREILNTNRDRIANFSELTPGTELTIDGKDYVVVQRNGTPYLIIQHDTLGKISRTVYGSRSYWRDLWKNNPQLIHDPNKIYAGFTLYYREKSQLTAPLIMGTKSAITTVNPRLPASPKKR